MADDGDLSDSKVPPQRGLDFNRQFKNELEKVWYRRALFAAFSVLSLSMLCCLLYDIQCLLGTKNLEQIAGGGDWHHSLFIVAGLVILASVPLTIFLALLKMASFTKQVGGQEEEEAGLSFSFTTPQLELLKKLFEFFRPASKE